MKTFFENVKRVFTNIDWANISVGTYVRYILMILGLVNLFLRLFGVNPIPFDENEVYKIVEAIYYAVVLIVNTYKDNPTSPEAIESNAYMKTLKEQHKEEASGNSNN